jgi:hypothetical protein
MSSITLTRRRLGAVVSAGLLLVGCGGGGGGGGGGTATPSPPPPPSALPTTSLASDSGRTTLTYMTAHLIVNDAVWDATNGLIQVVTAANSPTIPDSIVSLDPKTGLVQAAHELSGESKAIAVSGNGQYVYAGLSNGGGVARVHAVGLTPDISFAVGSSTSTVSKISISPTSVTTIAVIVNHLDATDGDHPGIELFDNAVLRPAILHGTMVLDPSNNLIVSANDLHWSADGTMIYATIDHGIVDLAVAATGVSMAQFRFWPVSDAGRMSGTRLFLNDGRVFDLAESVQQPGRFVDYNNPSMARAELLQNHKTFSTQDHVSESTYGPGIDGMTVNAFDENTFALIDTITWKGMTTATSGRLFAWGTNGIAWADANGFIIASGTFAESNGGAAPATTPAVVATGSFTGTNGAVNFTVLDFGANDVAVDSCNHLYVATSGTSSLRPNSIIVFDPSSGTIAASGYAGSEPY